MTLILTNAPSKGVLVFSSVTVPVITLLITGSVVLCAKATEENKTMKHNKNKKKIFISFVLN